MKLINETTFKPVLVGEYETDTDLLKALYDEYRRVCKDDHVYYEATMYRVEDYAIKLDSKTIPDLIYIIEGNMIITALRGITDAIIYYEHRETDDEIEKVALENSLKALKAARDDLLERSSKLKDIYDWYK